MGRKIQGSRYKGYEKREVISQEMLNRIPEDEEYDARDDDNSNVAGNITKLGLTYLPQLPYFCPRLIRDGWRKKHKH